MLRKKRILIVILAIISIVIIIMQVNKRNNVVSITPEEAISKINEDCFSISIDAYNNQAVVDGNTVKLNELFAISEKELDEMLANNTFETYLEENLTGDIAVNGSQIDIDNPYSTNTLIIEANNENDLKKYDDIESIKKIADDIYMVHYDSAIDTKNAYNTMQDDNKITNIVRDHKVYMTDSSTQISSVRPNYTAWGVVTTGLNNYKTKIDYSGSEDEILVAVLDTGINPNHEAFMESETADRLDFTYAHNYVNNTDDVTDDNRHGTAVAGLIAESTSTNVKIVPVKVLNNKGEGSVSDTMDAIQDLCEYVDIVNLSLGTDITKFTESELTTLNKFYKEIYDAGTIVVCAAGNDKTAVAYPGASQYTLTASAVDSSNNFATSFSNYGPEVDFALPGVDIEAPYYGGTNSYAYMSGTSFSCPLLAAAVADVISDQPCESISDVVDVLKDNAVDLGDDGKDNLYGYGSINFNVDMFSKPVIAKVESPNDTWATENSIIVKAVCGKNMVSYAITTQDVEPSEWNDVVDGTTAIELDITTSNNGTNYVWVKDESNNVVRAPIEIQYADNIVPSIANFEVTNTRHDKIETVLNIQDSQSRTIRAKVVLQEIFRC